MKINSHTSLYCVFGNPARHSLSPIIHNTLFEKMGINAVYLAFEIKTAKEGVDSMRTLHISGASVTIPFKVDVMNHIDEIDPFTRKMGAVNTLCNRDGKIIGYNTDGHGAVKALMNRNVGIKNANILILGNGGSARAIAFTLLNHHGNVYIAGRDPQKLSRLTDTLKEHYANVGYVLNNQLDINFMKSINIIINTTPVGMAPDDGSSPINPDLIEGKHVVFDIVYYPERTLLLRKAAEKKCTVIRGIEMLVYQGLRQFEIWTGRQPSENEVFHKISAFLYGESHGY